MNNQKPLDNTEKKETQEDNTPKHLSDADFALYRSMLEAPSPTGMEGGMMKVVRQNMMRWMPDSWRVSTFTGNAGLVTISHQKETQQTQKRLNVMVTGHTDKIRAQVASVSKRIYIACDSHLPSMLVGREVDLFSEDPENIGTWRKLSGGTIQAVPPVHLAKPEMRKGDIGIKETDLYLELGIHGKDAEKQLKALNIKPGDPIITPGSIERGPAPGVVRGAFMDNSFGCYVTYKVAERFAKGNFEHINLISAFATGEEMGRFGSRILASETRPDVIIAVDVGFDTKDMPMVEDQRLEAIGMGDGLGYNNGSICNHMLNDYIMKACKNKGIPLQASCAPRDTGTDAMAGVLASIDAAAASVFAPIRHMHTKDEMMTELDINRSVEAVFGTLEELEKNNVTANDFKNGHVNLLDAKPFTWPK